MQTAVAPLPAPSLGRWANANELPVIDFAPLGGRNAEAIDRIAREVHDACRDIGFLVISGHDIAPEMVEETREVARDFFDLPLDETGADQARRAAEVGRLHAAAHDPAVVRPD